MVYEAEVVFYQHEPLIFARNSERVSLVLNSRLKCWVSVERDQLTFMTSENYPFCHLYLSNYLLQTNPQQLSLTILRLSPKNNLSPHDTSESNTHPSDHSEKILLLKASEACLARIQSQTPKKAYKSCLSFMPSAVQHVSILSGESPTQKYRGFLNLIAVMFFILNLRNIIDNFLKYGALFKSSRFGVIPLEALVGLVSLLVFAETGRLLEWVRFKSVLSSGWVTALSAMNVGVLVMYVVAFCRWQLDESPLSGLMFVGFGVVFALKLVSYLQVNAELWEMEGRLRRLSEQEFIAFAFSRHEISEANLAFLQQERKHGVEVWVRRSRLYYFLLAPTLCYQLSYPRSEGIRWSWVAKRAVEFVVILGFELVVWKQYIVPELEQWAAMPEDYSNIQLANHILRLAVPNTVGWILGFYNFFHIFLNIMAELTHFGDRNFYKDWWNCRNLEEYWKTWNLPVHFWFIRHCYNPLLARGLSRSLANFIVFLISALAHEFLLAVPLGVVSYYAFLAMLLQAPAILFQRYLTNILRLTQSELGNVSFWLFFCVFGQPIILFIYYSLYEQRTIPL